MNIHCSETKPQTGSYAPQNSAQEVSKNGSNQARLLIVDDESDLRDLIAFDFTRKGYEVHTAAGGHAAWTQMNTLLFDLVITDIKMPEGDGIELLGLIKSHFPKIPVICLTGFAELSSESILSLGAAAILEKPFERKKLHEAVAMGIQKKSE